MPSRLHLQTPARRTNPELLDYADEYGMLMWVENRFINRGVQPIEGPHATPAPLPPSVAVADAGLLKDAQDMVLRDRNQ